MPALPEARHYPVWSPVRLPEWTSARGREIPIIIFSTKEESEIQRLAEDAGADGYIVKRMNRKDIVESVEHFYDKLCRDKP